MKMFTPRQYIYLQYQAKKKLSGKFAVIIYIYNYNIHYYFLLDTYKEVVLIFVSRVKTDRSCLIRSNVPSCTVEGISIYTLYSHGDKYVDLIIIKEQVGT